MRYKRKCKFETFWKENIKTHLALLLVAQKAAKEDRFGFHVKKRQKRIEKDPFSPKTNRNSRFRVKSETIKAEILYRKSLSLLLVEGESTFVDFSAFLSF